LDGKHDVFVCQTDFSLLNLRKVKVNVIHARALRGISTSATAIRARWIFSKLAMNSLQNNEITSKNMKKAKSHEKMVRKQKHLAKNYLRDRTEFPIVPAVLSTCHQFCAHQLFEMNKDEIWCQKDEISCQKRKKS
jgi:hypothetical protein